MTAIQSDGIRAMVHGNLERFAVPGAVVAILHGGETRILPFGSARPEIGRPVNEETVFPIASCSKAFTATIVASLVAEQRLSFDDPVRKHLPEFTMDDPWISEHATLRDLLGMRLGLAREGLCNWGRNRDVPHATVFRRLQHMTRIAGFREAFTYLNPAYTALAEIVARTAGEPYAKVLRDRLLAPLGMTDSFLDEGRPDAAIPWARPHVTLNGVPAALPEARCGGREGESCMYVSGRDALRWLAFNLSRGRVEDRVIVPEETFAAVHSAQIACPPAPILGQSFAEYCMGWSATDSHGRRFLYHTGTEFGAVSYTLLCPQAGLGIAVYSVGDRMAAVMSTALMLQDMILDAPQRDWGALFLALAPQEEAGFAKMMDAFLPVPAGVPPVAPERCVGTYESGHSGRLHITLGEGRLRLHLDDGELFDGWLEPLGGGLFHPHFDYPGMVASIHGRTRFDFVMEGPRAAAVRAFALGHFRRIDDHGAGA